MNNNIDFIIPWVDGNDPKWQKSFNKFAPIKDRLNVTGAERYRDWNLLRFWFRGVEKFAPWFHKIYFITCGQKPEWLNLHAERLVWIKHEDYIPKEYLPVFNVNPLELNLHKIKGLSDKFVYFNDDTFIINHISEQRFFRDGLPCDTAICNIISPTATTNIAPYMYVNNMSYINDHFNKYEQMRRNFRKWFNFKYGTAQLRSLMLLPWPNFSNLLEQHLPNAYLKSTFEEIWALYGEELLQSSMTRFREISNCNQWLMRDWRLIKGEFTPIDITADSYKCILGEDKFETIIKHIKLQKDKMICINDGSLTLEQVDYMKPLLIDAFESILPEKSSFEL